MFFLFSYRESIQKQACVFGVIFVLFYRTFFTFNLQNLIFLRFLVAFLGIPFYNFNYKKVRY